MIINHPLLGPRDISEFVYLGDASLLKRPTWDSNKSEDKFYEYLSSIFMPFQQINQLVNSKKNVAHHYDINEDLYKLFLDQDMQYSCAYFHNPNMSLDQAQKDKKQHIIKKLQITENMDVLDIGCGWGGMAIEIAKSTGAKVKGITLSENQFKTASERAQKEGLADKVSFALQDYRNETAKYDRIVSVGMFEHVGVKYFKTYLSKANDILKENGVFLLHTIGQRGKPTATSPWIRKYIFPGGYIPSLSEIMNATQKLNINVTDVGEQEITYSVADAGGNTNTATRSVTVQDTTDPVITLNQGTSYTQNLNTAWVDPGYDANDTLDGNLTAIVADNWLGDYNTCYWPPKNLDPTRCAQKKMQPSDDWLTSPARMLYKSGSY